MGLFDRVNTRAVTWNRVFGDGIPGARTASGTTVNEEKALRYSVVWASVTLISDALSSLPPEAYREDPETGIRSRVPVPRWVMRPSQTFRRQDLIAQLLMSVLLWGNGYALLVRRDSDGVVVGLTVLDPSDVECRWSADVRDIPRNEGRSYRINGSGPWLTEGDVLHIQGPTLPGRAEGLSVIGAARESIGLGLTLEEFGARYFGQGSHHKVVIKVPKKALQEKESRDLVRQYEQFTRGPGNWHRPAVVSGQDVDIVNISIPPEDSQFLESREFQAVDVARWFRVPPHRVGIISKETSWGSGLAEQNTAMVQTTYRPWITRLEAAFTYYSPGGEDSGILITLNTSELLRGAFADMVTAFREGVEGQIFTPNEARKALGYDPVEGGDDLVKPEPTQNLAPPAERIIVLPADYRHLPGQHDQKKHGKTLHASPEYSDLDAKGQAAVDGALAEHGISIDELEGHMFDVCAKADMSAARAWYPEAHNFATSLAEKHGVSVEQAAAVISLTSPRTAWPRNQKLADRVLSQHKNYEGLSASETADRIGGGLRANMVPAVEVARDSSLIDSRVTGTKRRSFYNNILAPGETRDVTVDTWMMESLTSTADSSTFNKDTALKLLSARQAVTKVGAGYVGVSEAARRVADRTGETPDTIQSAYWITMSGSTTGATKKGGLNG